jgi:phosphatidate cytidylyltransferase
MKRLATAAVAVPLALAAVFYLPGLWFLLAVLVVFELAVLEYVNLAERLAPEGPYRLLLVLVPLAAFGLAPQLWQETNLEMPFGLLGLGFFVLSVGLGTLALVFRVPVEQGLAALGAMAFGVPYLSLPAASLYQLQQRDPWVLVLLFAIVWLGDTAAYYCGRAWGRRKLAPRVSPNKTWEGAIASLLAGVLAAMAWSLLRLGTVNMDLLILAAVTSVAAQGGDLVESLIKRGAGVKDSGTLLPGHGGVLDRIDALLFAAPTLLLGLTLVDLGSSAP